MRKIYLLMAVISLFVLTVSCSNDDNFDQVVKQANENQIKVDSLKKKTISHTLESNIKPNRGGEDKDRDKKNGK